MKRKITYQDDELVSIIIPVFNAEKYIEKCVNSLINQTYKNIEIIIVNDGSKDNSIDIINKLKKKDNRIIVIDKENEGVSKTRTAGIENANGEFLMFIDADDFVDNDYVSYFYNLINYNNKKYDIAVNYNKYCIHTPNQVKEEKVEVLKSEKVVEDIYTSKINEAVWNKIYRRKFLEDNKITFNPEIWYGEGMLYNIQCLQYTDDVVVGNKRVYHQYYNIDSAMRNFNMESNLCGLKSLDLQKSSWKKINNDIENAWNFHKYCFNMSILKGIIKTNAKEKYKKEYKDCIKSLRKGWRYPLKANVSLQRRCFYIFSSAFPVLGAKIFLFIEKKSALKFIKNNNIEVG